MPFIGGESMMCDFNKICRITDEQYTGLKDKNGIRIFEGDIVRKRVGKDKKDLPVIFEAGCFCCSSIRYTLDDCRIEIVGDIYDKKYKELHKYLLEHY